MPRITKSDTLEIIESNLELLPGSKFQVVLDFIEYLRDKLIDRDLSETMLLAQPLLAEDWLNPEEEAAWQDL